MVAWNKIFGEGNILDMGYAHFSGSVHSVMAAVIFASSFPNVDVLIKLDEHTF